MNLVACHWILSSSESMFMGCHTGEQQVYTCINLMMSQRLGEPARTYYRLANLYCCFSNFTSISNYFEQKKKT